MIASGLLMVLVGSGFVVLLVSVQGLRASQDQAQRTSAVLNSAHQVERLVADLATGQRDFVITGQEKFLQPWEQAAAQLPEQTDALQGLVAGSPDEVARAQAAGRSITSYLQDYSLPQIELAQRDPDSARTAAAISEGTRRVTAIRSVLDTLITFEEQLSATEQRHSDAIADRAVVAATAGLAGSVVLVLGFTVYLSRAIVRPVRVTAEMATRLAAGELTVRVPESGVGEIRTLERTFNTMASSLGTASADLAASRARIVRSADETRRRIERDLHDGIQQRLVSIALDVRALQADGATVELEGVANDLAEALDELREIARGIHPAILTQGGIAPAVRMLARRSKLPVVVDVDVPGRLPAPIEAAAYYVVSEALTNAAKHADASVALVDVRLEPDRLRLSVRDDGHGGADPSNGSGLVGLADRIAALDGTLVVESPSGKGTTLTATLPL
ncbi:signal transduction histidine kinase [Kribbella aluminosa]|uniref:histidine kinase n=1 Tax=Kribbella aluminosa TaxID=416017 RepID=A0ABS4UGY7_9ACTN|nr:CHASE3 domain-containing protein [Kribbella aluminosa]MBP2350831.1 signal transduction histidine kinase [Kribbella aluminosa]